MTVNEVRVMIHVQDLAAEATFWTEQLGFDVIRSFDGGVMLSVGATTVEFFDSASASVPNAGFSLQMTDLDVLWNKWSGRGEIGFALRNNPWGDRSFSVMTPNRIEVIFFQQD